VNRRRNNSPKKKKSIKPISVMAKVMDIGLFIFISILVIGTIYTLPSNIGGAGDDKVKYISLGSSSTLAQIRPIIETRDTKQNKGKKARLQ
jgi:hypothetical protein